MKTIKVMEQKEFGKTAAGLKRGSCGLEGPLDFYLVDSVYGPPRFSRKGSKARLDQFGECDPVVVHFGE